MMTPILLQIFDLLLKSGKLFNGSANKKLSQRISEETPTVIICGFGRMGQIIAQMLEAEHISYVAIDGNVDEVIMAREQGYNVIYGDSKKQNILLAAGLKPRKTRAVVISLNDEAVARDIIETVHGFLPNVKIFARARNLKSSKELLQMGAKFATPEIVESSLIMGAEVLSSIGLSPRKVNYLKSRLRENGYENVKKPLDVVK